MKQLLRNQSVSLILALLFANAASAQPFVEVGVFGGVSNYYGDLTQDYVVVKESHPAYGGFITLNASPNLGFRLGVNHGIVSAADANSNRATLNVRNLSFTSPVTEATLTVVYSYPGFIPRSKIKPFTPYLYFGIGGFHFNPEAFYEGQWYELQPLGTEGQGTDIFPYRDKYSLYSVCIPFGIGLKWAFTERWNLGIEYGARWTFTDYLDDVSRTYVDRNLLIEASGINAYNLSNRTGEVLGGVPVDYKNNDWRGDPSNNDWYMFFGLTLSRNLLKGAEEGFKTMNTDILGCPGSKHYNKPKKHHYKH